MSECQLDGLAVRAGSVRGLLHRHRGQPRQDAFVLHPTATGVVGVVCDGVGSLPLSHLAAQFVARELAIAYDPGVGWTTALDQVNRSLTDYAAEFGERQMASTVVAAHVHQVAGALRAELIWTDDSVAWVLAKDGSWSEVQGSAATLAGPNRNAQVQVHTGSVRALPAAAPRTFTASLELTAAALVLMTDGIGTPLSGSAEVASVLSSWWAEPPDVFSFAVQCNFAAKTHLDDRTAIGFWPLAPACDPIGQ